MKHFKKKETTTPHTRSKPDKATVHSTKVDAMNRKMASKESVAQSASKVMREHSAALKWLADK